MKPLPLPALILIIFSILLFQCRKIEPYGQTNTGNQVSTTLCGLVTDESGLALENAFVLCNGKNTMTTAQGIFVLNQVSALENKTDIEISKDGYFKTYKTILVKNGQQQFIKTILLRKDNMQYFDAGIGGNVAFGNQVSFTFPANALVNKNTGIAYTGQAEMVVKYIDPTTRQGLLSMPGNLTGLDANQKEKVLASYGMLAAEIYDQAGNLLQVKPNTQVQMSMQIPLSMIPTAKQTIPMWYFDETKAIWIEEGNATLNGNRYIGQVSHFTFWNCDAPKDFIKLEMTLLDQNNYPISGKPVRLTDLSDGAMSQGITDAKGWVGGMVPGNANLKMEVLAPDICGAVAVYSSTFVTGNTSKNLGVLTVNVKGNNPCQLSGKLLNCKQAAVSNGMVYVEELQEVVFANQSGHFSLNLPCTPASSIKLFCHDLSTNQFDTLVANLQSGVNTLGNVSACGSSGNFCKLTIKKVNSTDSFMHSYYGHLDELFCSITQPDGTQFVMGKIGTEKTMILYANGKITTGQYNVVEQLWVSFPGPQNIFGEGFWDPDHLGTITITSNSPYPGDVTGFFEIPMKGVATNQDYLFYGDFRIPKINDF